MNADAAERRLIEAAIEAAERAYAPYSGFCVGAAVRMDDGRLGTGANVENASYGLSICAEANAITTLIAQRIGKVVQLAVVGWPKDQRSARTLATPCGRCRQILLEFATPDAAVLVAHGDGTLASRYAAHDLLPFAFGPRALSTTPAGA